MRSARNSNEGGLPSLLISIADGVIDLGWGHPSEELHPLADLRRAAEFVLGGESVAALQYGAVQGFGPLLESLSGFLSNQPAYGMDVPPEQLFLTSGASQGLDMACTLFTQAGDTVYVEEPTYHLAHGIFRDHRLNVEGVATDAHGMRMDALEDKLTKTESPNPAALYIIPTYQNPTGRVLPEERRRRLVQLADEHGFVVFADEVYQLLHAGAPPPPPLVAFDRTPRGRVVSIGSFSKILSPGLRAGWVQANAALTARFTNSGFAISGGGISHFASNIAHAAIALGLLEENVARLRATYAERIRAVDTALRERLAGRCSYADANRRLLLLAGPGRGRRHRGAASPRARSGRVVPAGQPVLRGRRALRLAPHELRALRRRWPAGGRAPARPGARRLHRRARRRGKD